MSNGVEPKKRLSLSAHFLKCMIAADLDFALFFSRLCEIVGKLHPQPRFRRAAKCLGETYRHLGADPRLSVQNVVERLPGDAKDLRPLRDGESQRFKIRGANAASGMRRIFHRHDIAPRSWRLVVV